MLSWVGTGLLAVALAGGGPATPPPAAVGCPGNHQATGRIVWKALAEERLGWFRKKYGLEHLRPRQLRALADGRNDVACTALNKFYETSFYMNPRFKRTYFRAGSYYFASFVDSSDPKKGRVHMNHFALFDAEFRLVATLKPK